MEKKTGKQFLMGRFLNPDDSMHNLLDDEITDSSPIPADLPQSTIIRPIPIRSTPQHVEQHANPAPVQSGGSRSTTANKTHCEVCNIDILPSNLARHNKTKKHRIILLGQSSGQCVQICFSVE